MPNARIANPKRVHECRNVPNSAMLRFDPSGFRRGPLPLRLGRLPLGFGTWDLGLGISLMLISFRQQYSERCSSTWCRLYLDLAVVQLNDPIHHRQTDARSMILRREVEIKDLVQV